MSKRIATLTALAALAVAPAMAQSNNPAPVNPSAAPSTNSSSMTRTFLDNQASDQWLATKLIGAAVTAPSNEKIGSVNDLLLDPSGNVVAAVIGVGGFLGIGEKDVAISFKSLTVTRADNGAIKVSTQVSKNELQQAAAFKAYEPARANTTRPATTTTQPRSNM
jgi:hypothetical protein